MTRKKPDSPRSPREWIAPVRPARDAGLPQWKAMQGGDLRWEEGEIQKLHRARIDEVLAEYEADPSPLGFLRMLRKLGHQVTQPSARPDLQEPGAVRSGEGDPIRSWIERADESPFRKVQDLILTVVAVEPAMVLMNTKDGAGPAVGAAIEGSDWWDVLAGTSASSSTVLLVTENQSLRDQVMDRLKFFAGRYGKAGGEIERQRHHE